MSLISDMLGTKVQEFTGTAAVPAMVTGSAVMGLSRLQKLRKRKRIKEDGGLIPDDAEATDGNNDPLQGGKSDDNDLEGQDPEQVQAPSNSTRGLLSTSLALVAPDLTPDWNKELSPSLLPKPAASQPPPSPKRPVRPSMPSSKEEPAPMSVESMVRLSRPSAAGSPQPDVTRMLESSPAPDAPVGDLVKQGQPMPDHTPSSKGSSSFFSRVKLD